MEKKIRFHISEFLSLWIFLTDQQLTGVGAWDAYISKNKSIRKEIPQVWQAGRDSKIDWMKKFICEHFLSFCDFCSSFIWPLSLFQNLMWSKYFQSPPFNTDSQNGDGVQVNAPLVFWTLGEKENCPVTARIILSSTTLQIGKLYFTCNHLLVCLFTINRRTLKDIKRIWKDQAVTT